MSTVGGTCSSSLMEEERYWLSNVRSSMFCTRSVSVASRSFIRASSRPWYFSRLPSRFFHTRIILSPTTPAMRAQYSFSRSCTRRLTPATRLAPAICFWLPLPPPGLGVSFSMNSLSRRTASSGCTATSTPSSPSSPAAAAFSSAGTAPLLLLSPSPLLLLYVLLLADSASMSASKLAPSVTPSARRMDSTLTLPTSSLGSASSILRVLESIRKPASSVSRPSAP
mmetsp:Transcript_18056/g.45714  ORF Transcript_18056/g.45714 Transcript_18056/m.45714 type:complete len:225 (+) Transcript_18056:259-933(+)